MRSNIVGLDPGRGGLKQLADTILSRVNVQPLLNVASREELEVAAIDLFTMFYRDHVIVSEEPNPSPFLEGLRQLMKLAQGHEAFKRVHALTAGNEELSILATIEVLNALSDLARSNGEFRQACKTGNIGRAAKDVLAAFGTAASRAETLARYALLAVGGRQAGKQPGALLWVLDLRDRIMRVEDVEQIVTIAESLVESLPRHVKARKRIGKRGDEVYGYAQTRRIEDALPRELALDDEIIEAKLLGGGLLTRVYATWTEGSYYVLIDKSGSMAGTKTIWARSVALALLNLATRRRRRYYMRFFDYAVYDLASKPSEIAEALIRVAPNGGTCIDCALRTAIQDIERGRLAEKLNTIIIITDGEDDVETQPQELRRVNATLIAVMVQGHNPALQALAQQTGGAYLSVQPTQSDALKILDVTKQ